MHWKSHKCRCTRPPTQWHHSPLLRRNPPVRQRQRWVCPRSQRFFRRWQLEFQGESPNQGCRAGNAPRGDACPLGWRDSFVMGVTGVDNVPLERPVFFGTRQGQWLGPQGTQCTGDEISLHVNDHQQWFHTLTHPFWSIRLYFRHYNISETECKASPPYRKKPLPRTGPVRGSGIFGLRSIANSCHRECLPLWGPESF